MAKNYDNLKKALQIYFQRGKMIIDHLMKDDLDSAQTIVRLRRAAFLNMRAYEATCKQNELKEFYSSPEILILWDKISKQDDDLANTIEKKKDKLTKLFIKTKNEKTTINKFRSKSTNKETFQTTI